jgi:hypothetical protein
MATGKASIIASHLENKAHATGSKDGKNARKGKEQARGFRHAPSKRSRRGGGSGEEPVRAAYPKCREVSDGGPLFLRPVMRGAVKVSVRMLKAD